MGLPGWPGGDPDAIRGAAKAWEGLHDSLLSVVTTAHAPMQSMFDDWEGKAARSFQHHWTQFENQHRSAAKGALQVSKQLDSFADKLEEAHKKYEHMVEVAAATAVVGIGLSIVTLGVSDAAGAAVEAGVLAEVTTLLTELGVELEAAAALAEGIAASLGGLAESVVGGVVDFTIGFATNAGGQAVESELDGEGLKVNFDQAFINGVAGLALKPLVAGKGLPTRFAVGAGVQGTAGALSQLDDLLLHGGAKDGKTFNVDTLLVDLLAGGVAGGLGKGGPSAADTAESTVLRDLDGIDFVIGSDGVVSTPADVAAAARAAAAPEVLREQIDDIVRDKGLDASKDVIQKSIEINMALQGGPHAVQNMSSAEIQAMAHRIVAGARSVSVPTPAHASAR